MDHLNCFEVVLIDLFGFKLMVAFKAKEFSSLSESIGFEVEMGDER